MGGKPLSRVGKPFVTFLRKVQSNMQLIIPVVNLLKEALTIYTKPID
jgi:hypothetical protein